MHTMYSLLAQLPLGTPNPDNNTPIDFTSPFDVIVFIILPILMIIFYVIWRKNQKNNK